MEFISDQREWHLKNTDVSAIGEKCVTYKNHI